MQEHGQVFIFTVSVAVFLVTILLVRQRLLSERYSIFWLLFSLTTLLLSSVGYRFIFMIARYLDIPYPPSALFLLSIVGLLLLMLHLTVVISNLANSLRILTQEMSLLRLEMEQGREGSRALTLEEEV